MRTDGVWERAGIVDVCRLGWQPLWSGGRGLLGSLSVLGRDVVSDQEAFGRILVALYDAMLDDAYWPTTLPTLIDEAYGLQGHVLATGGSPQDERKFHDANARFSTTSKSDPCPYWTREMSTRGKKPLADLYRHEWKRPGNPPKYLLVILLGDNGHGKQEGGATGPSRF